MCSTLEQIDSAVCPYCSSVGLDQRMFIASQVDGALILSVICRVCWRTLADAQVSLLSDYTERKREIVDQIVFEFDKC